MKRLLAILALLVCLPCCTIVTTNRIEVCPTCDGMDESDSVVVEEGTVTVNG